MNILLPQNAVLVGDVPEEYYQPEAGVWSGRGAVEDFKPSTNIADTWRGIEHLRAQGWTMHLSCNDYVNEPWDCRLFLRDERREIAHGSTAEQALCRAALKAATAR